MSKLSDHLEKHKWKYILGGTIVVAGITTLIVRKNLGLLGGPYPRLLGGPGGSGKIAVDNTARSFSFNMFSDNAGNTTINHNAVTTIHNGARGNSGFVTRCVDTGEVFSTQNAAAKAFNISPSVLSSHLNEGVPLKEGLTFERLALMSLAA